MAQARINGTFESSSNYWLIRIKFIKSISQKDEKNIKITEKLTL